MALWSRKMIEETVHLVGVVSLFVVIGFLVIGNKKIFYRVGYYPEYTCNWYAYY